MGVCALDQGQTMHKECWCTLCQCKVTQAKCEQAKASCTLPVMC